MLRSSADVAYGRRNAVALHVPLKQALESRVVALAAVVAIGAALILPRLGAQSLWLDESLTVGPAVTATSASDLFMRVRAVDTQPPASHLLLWALDGHLPRSEFFYRLPSFVAVELGIVMLYALTRRLWGPLVALAAATCAQLSPYLAFYAAEARNYGLWFLCIITSALLTVYWYDAARTRATGRAWRWALALALVNAAGLWTHLFQGFVVLAEVVIVAVAALAGSDPWHDRLRSLASFAAAQIVTVLLFAPWMVVVWRAARSGTAGVPWTRPFTLASVAYYLFAAHFGVSLGPDLRSLHVRTFPALAAAHPFALALAAAAIAVTVVTFAVLVRHALRVRERRWELVPLLAWPALTVAGPLAYAASRSFPLHPRHLLLAWPLVPMVLALGLVRVRRLRPLLLAVLALQAVALGNLLFNDHYAKDDERGAVRFAERSSGPAGYVLGDVAPLYVTRAAGRLKPFTAFPADTTDVWLVDNRTWEPQNRRARARLASTMRTMGMRYQGGTTQFRGIVLRHWTAPES